MYKYMRDVAVDANDRLVVVGHVQVGASSNMCPAMWRYLASGISDISFGSDGSLDTAFGSSGVFLLQAAGGGTVNYSDTLRGILLDANGKAVIAGANNN